MERFHYEVITEDNMFSHPLWVLLLVSLLILNVKTQDSTPAQDTPAEDTTTQDTTTQNTPTENTPAENTPAQNTPAQNTPAENTPAQDSQTQNPMDECEDEAGQRSYCLQFYRDKRCQSTNRAVQIIVKRRCKKTCGKC